MTRLPLLLLTVAAATIFGACTGGSGAGSSVAPSPLGLDGRTFLSTDIKGMALAPGSRITLTFKDGSLNASGGCNSMGGSYTAADGRLTTAQMFMTEMACAEPLMAQDQWLSTFLADVAYLLEGDTLKLDDGSVQLTLLDKEVATPDQPIEDTLWVVDGIVSGDTISSVPAGVTASIRIVDGKVEVNAGCNTGGGTVEVNADTLAFGPIATTKKACDADTSGVESAVLSTLTGTVDYSIDADVLTLDAGDTGLMLRAAP